MANCCDGKQSRKIKEWGTESKENKNNSKIKILSIVGMVIILGIIIFTQI